MTNTVINADNTIYPHKHAAALCCYNKQCVYLLMYSCGRSVYTDYALCEEEKKKTSTGTTSKSGFGHIVNEIVPSASDRALRSLNKSW